MQRDQCTLHPVFPSGNILHKFSIDNITTGKLAVIQSTPLIQSSPEFTIFRVK